MFQHRFHDEGVHKPPRRKFETQHCRATRREVLVVDDYVCKRAGSDSDGRGSEHKLAGLKHMEKYSGPDDEHAEQ